MTTDYLRSDDAQPFSKALGALPVIFFATAAFLAVLVLKKEAGAWGWGGVLAVSVGFGLLCAAAAKAFISPCVLPQGGHPRTIPRSVCVHGRMALAQSAARWLQIRTARWPPLSLCAHLLPHGHAACAGRVSCMRARHRTRRYLLHVAQGKPLWYGKWLPKSYEAEIELGARAHAHAHTHA